MTTTLTDAPNPDVHAIDTGRDGRARTWLKPEQVERLRDECLTDTSYLQDRDKAILTLAYDAGLRAGAPARSCFQNLRTDLSSSLVQHRRPVKGETLHKA